MIRRIIVATGLAVAVAAAPGVANAVPGEPGQCTGYGYCKVEPVSNGDLDGSFVVVKPPSAWDQFRSIAGHAVADFIFGPRW